MINLGIRENIGAKVIGEIDNQLNKFKEEKGYLAIINFYFIVNSIIIQNKLIPLIKRDNVIVTHILSKFIDILYETNTTFFKVKKLSIYMNENFVYYIFDLVDPKTGNSFLKFPIIFKFSIQKFKKEDKSIRTIRLFEGFSSSTTLEKDLIINNSYTKVFQIKDRYSFSKKIMKKICYFMLTKQD